MRYAIIADIHANLNAFTAVLDDISRRGGVNEYLFLGDIVGYGPEPHGCIELVRELNPVCLAGNHDLAAIGKLDIADFNPFAAEAVKWTRTQLTAGDIDYLGNLPLTMVKADFTMVHGSPRDPVWEYLLSTMAAKENFDYFQTQFCLVGHSHVPVMYELEPDGECLLRCLNDDVPFKLAGNRCIINPGSIGQPRDSNPRASYVIYDSESRLLINHRIPYNLADTQEKMRVFELPEELVERLNYGE